MSSSRLCLIKASGSDTSLNISYLQVYRIRPSLPATAGRLIAQKRGTRTDVLYPSTNAQGPDRPGGGWPGRGRRARYWLGKVEDENAGHDYELIAAPLDVELVPGFKTEAWAFGPSAPGTELRVRQGTWLRVRFINHLPVETTIHWHGIRLPLEMDGVPYVSQLPVKPGEFFDYKFRVPDAGSYWYHPHVSSSEELGRGLVGPVDRRGARADRIPA